MPRPACILPHERTWIDSCKDTFRVAPAELISLHNLFGMFVDKFGEYPRSAEDLLVFVATKTLSPTAARKHTTLPARIIDIVKDVFDETSDVRAQVPALEFKLRWNASRTIAARVAIERDSHLPVCT